MFNKLSFFSIIILLLIFLNSNLLAEPTHVTAFNVRSEESTPTGVAFNSGGTRMYVIGIDSDTIRQYTLSTCFDLSSTVTLEQSVSITSLEGNPQDIAFNSDGTVIFIAGTAGNGIDSWSLSTAYDISSMDATDDHIAFKSIGGDPRDLEFNSDGTKMFILNGRTEVKEYALSTAYDPDTLTLTNTFSISLAPGFGQGMGFSSDGKKMFLVASSTNKIHFYNLTTGFDLSTASFIDAYEVSTSASMNISGLAFNSDGTKMFHADFSEDEIQEYSLPCSYGVVVTCPEDEKDDVASVEAQSEITKKFLQSTTIPVLNRMEWLRRNKNNPNLTNQNIKFQSPNEMVLSLMNAVGFSASENKNYMNETIDDLMPSRWSSWSEGNISIGRSEAKSNSSIKKINTLGITIGADKKISEKKMYGVAFRMGNDDVDIGNLGNLLDMNAYSLTLYGTRPQGENNFIDALIGISMFKTDIVNVNGTNKLESKRDGEQIFGSLKFRRTLNKNKFNFTPTGKIDLGYTLLSEYSETGENTLTLKFEEQKIETIITSIGMILDKSINVSSGILKPNAHLEYNADLSPASESRFSRSDSNTTYILGNVNDADYNVRVNLGTDFIKNNGWSFKANYERNESNTSYYDNVYFGTAYISARDTEYSLSLDGDKTFANYTKKMNGIEILINTDYSVFSEMPDYNVSLIFTIRF